MLDRELGSFRNPEPLASNLYPERPVLLYGIGKSPQLCDHLSVRVDAFHDATPRGRVHHLKLAFAGVDRLHFAARHGSAAVP